jgi:hypothetical protein
MGSTSMNVQVVKELVVKRKRLWICDIHVVFGLAEVCLVEFVMHRWVEVGAKGAVAHAAMSILRCYVHRR